jgi:NAD-dependent deacetylase
MDRASALAAGADLMLCVGSSLEVYPAAGLPELTLEAGGKIAIVTKSATPLDRHAAVRLDGDVEEEMQAVLSRL